MLVSQHYLLGSGAENLDAAGDAFRVVVNLNLEIISGLPATHPQSVNCADEPYESPFEPPERQRTSASSDISLATNSSLAKAAQ